jgi:hydroxyacylglutathione hydrolase
VTIKAFTFNPFEENSYVVSDETGECIIIDPGCYEKWEQDELKNYIRSNNLTVKQLINTHCHIDHVLGNYFVEKEFNAKVWIHKVEEPYLKAVKTYAPNYGMQMYQEGSVGGFLDEDGEVSFGNSSLKILFLPGHSPGHLAFYNLKQKICIAGDVLFRQSIGRTDLPGGNFNTLISSITTKLFKLPDDIVVYPGHGESTTIGFEKKYNPFLVS